MFCTIDYSLRTIDGRTTWVVIYFIYAGIPLVIALVKIIADIIDRIELKYRSKHFPEKEGLSDDIPEQQPSPEKFRVSLKKKYAPEPTEDNEALLRYRMTGYEQAKRAAKIFVAIFVAVDIAAAIYSGVYFYKLAAYDRLMGDVVNVKAETIYSSEEGPSTKRHITSQRGTRSAARPTRSTARAATRCGRGRKCPFT